MSIPSSLPPAVYQAAASKTEVFNPNPTSWIDGLSVNSAPSSGWGASAGSSSSRSGSGSGLGSSSSFGGLGFGGGGSGGASGSGGSMDPFADPHRWDVSPQTKATADEFFVLLDENGRGSIDLETARAHLTQPGITASDLKRIW